MFTTNTKSTINSVRRMIRAFPGKIESGGVFSCRREYDSSFVLGGGQHGMPKPSSEDLRARVIAAIEAGATRPEVADQYSVSLSSVGRFVRLDRETGSVSAAKFGGYKEFALAAHEVLVRQLVAQQPDVTLAELVTQLSKKRITVGKSSVSRFLHHLKLSFKKKSAGRRAGPAGRRRGA